MLTLIYNRKREVKSKANVNTSFYNIQKMEKN